MPTRRQYVAAVPPRLAAASRHAGLSPSTAGSMTRNISGIWKYRYTVTSPQKPVMNPGGRSTPTVLMIFVAKPCVPNEAMNMNARTMPPMLAATPENAMATLRSQRGRCMRTTTRANRVPTSPPSSADTTETLSDSVK